MSREFLGEVGLGSKVNDIGLLKKEEQRRNESQIHRESFQKDEIFSDGRSKTAINANLLSSKSRALKKIEDCDEKKRYKTHCFLDLHLYSSFSPVEAEESGPFLLCLFSDEEYKWEVESITPCIPKK